MARPTKPRQISKYDLGDALILARQPHQFSKKICAELEISYTAYCAALARLREEITLQRGANDPLIMRYRADRGQEKSHKARPKLALVTGEHK